VQRCYQLRQCLVGGDVPAAITVVGPGVADTAAVEAPLQPAQLVMGDVLEQLDRRPARRKPAAPQLAGRQRFQFAHQPGPEIVEVAEEDLGARGHRNGGFRERQAHKDKPAAPLRQDGTGPATA